MTFKIPLEPAAHAVSPFGHHLSEPVDDAHTWPDLTHRPLSETERAALLDKVAHIRQAVSHFDDRLRAEDELLKHHPSLGEEMPPYVTRIFPGLISNLLSSAQHLLETGDDDEVATAHVRVAEALARLQLTWRDEVWQGKVEEMLARAEERTIPESEHPCFVVLVPSLEA